MKVLLIGSGGREHAIAWKIAQSPKLTRLFIAPGNPGTATAGENVAVKIDDHAGILRFCRKQQIDLVVIGPEAPLAAGLGDDLRAAGFKVFGPSKAAAEIEASKAFSKAFMIRHDIPTARYQAFTDFDAALAYLHSLDYPAVIKASGLAAGKGVIVPETTAEAESALRQVMLDHAFGGAGDEVIIEEKLSGPEVSLIAFADGNIARPMIPAQDHKRVFDGDGGPNTGGMGAYAPVPSCPPEMVTELTATILQPAIDGLRAEGRPFIGALYAGLMLTHDGPRVIEFNCRFGDPETQVILPLLDSDILEIFSACAAGRLTDTDIRWKDGAAACVVLASEGYPGKYPRGLEISGLVVPTSDAFVFHAGTQLADDKVLTNGGRVLCVSGWGSTIEKAVRAAYEAIQPITFEGMHYRKDIAWQALKKENSQPLGEAPSPTGAAVRLSAARSAPAAASISAPVSVPIRSSYEESGVSIDAGNRAVALMTKVVRSTYTPAVLAGIGSFGGLFDVSALKDFDHPVLVASTDGVGTKVRLAAAVKRYRSIGHDIVNHCINDILVQGARPLCFLDYFATSKLNPDIAAEVVIGISEACREAGIALLGGETAEMPGVYQTGEFDLAGTIIGVVERDHILPRADLKPGDVLVGLASSGPHTNGYSLIRKIFAADSFDAVAPSLGIPLSEALLAPHRSYAPFLSPHLGKVKALAHITGGGFIENIPRILPTDMDAHIHLGTWKMSPLWALIQQRGQIVPDEMYRVFNMGIGMLAVVDKTLIAEFQEAIPEPTFVIGELAKGAGKVVLEPHRTSSILE